jgi:hypothetical protein
MPNTNTVNGYAASITFFYYESVGNTPARPRAAETARDNVKASQLPSHSVGIPLPGRSEFINGLTREGDTMSVQS